MVALTAWLGLAIGGAGCVARSVGPGAVAQGDTGVAPDAPELAFSCDQLCASVMADPSCGSASAALCVAACRTQIATAPGACGDAANTVFVCMSTTPSRCAAGSPNPFAGCAAPYQTLVDCLATYAGGVFDAGAPDLGVIVASDLGVPPLFDAGTMAPRDTGVDVGRDTGPDWEALCPTYQNCLACTQRARCGWCDGQCLAGNNSGPSSGGSCARAWRRGAAQCFGTGPADAGFLDPRCSSCLSRNCGEFLDRCLSIGTCAECAARPSLPRCPVVPDLLSLADCACGVCVNDCRAACGGV